MLPETGRRLLGDGDNRFVAPLALVVCSIDGADAVAVAQTWSEPGVEILDLSEWVGDDLAEVG